MGKLVPVLAAGGGTVTASVGGFYLLQENGTGTEEGQPSSGGDVTSQIDTVSHELSFKTLEAFKQENGGDCAKYFLNGSEKVDLREEGDQINNSNNKIDANYFSNGTNAYSCLVINWERTDSSLAPTPKKWKGNFRWVWSFVKGNRGFIMFTATKLTSSTDKKLDLEGGIYFLKKDGGKWSLDKHKALDSSKNISKSNFTTVFPKVGELLTDVQNKDLWGFLSSESELDDVCTESEESSCTQDSDAEKKFRGSWLWSTGTGGTSGSLTKWSKDFAAYFPNMYSSEEVNLTSTLQSLSGSWSKKDLVEPSKTN